MTRQEANELIAASITGKRLEDFIAAIDAHQESIDYEIEHYGETEMEPMDFVDALFDLHDRTQDWIAECDDPRQVKTFKQDLRHYDRLLLQIGFYRPVTQHEIDNTIIVAGGRVRKCKFLKIDGVAVDCVSGSQ